MVDFIVSTRRPTSLISDQNLTFAHLSIMHVCVTAHRQHVATTLEEMSNNDKAKCAGASLVEPNDAGLKERDFTDAINGSAAVA